MINCWAALKGIPRELAWEVFTDMRVRQKWDRVMHQLEIVEEHREQETCIFHYVIPTPPFIQTRDALIEKKVLRDFPKGG